MPETRNPQLDVIETLDRPVIVQAGAGSGKTHTLTERIVAALTPDENGKTFARSIENIVAITFTRKAAEELKARLRTKLEASGMHEQALLVDDANITTIHGFASRILRENALIFGIDANFEIIDEAKDEQIFKNSLESSMVKMFSGVDVLEDLMANAAEQADEIFGLPDEDDDFDDDEYEELDLDIFAEEEKFEIADEIREHIESLISDFVTSQTSAVFADFISNELTLDGTISSKLIYNSVKRLADSFSTQPLNDEPRVFVGTHMEMNDILSKILELLRESSAKISFNNDNDKEAQNATLLADSIEKLDAFLKVKHDGEPPQIIYEKVLDIFDEIPKFSPKYHNKFDDFVYVQAHREVLARLMLEFMLLLNREAVNVFYRLATLTFEDMNLTKDDSLFSNNDLLRVCYQRLTRIPALADCYKDKFDLIMIDEFQDTDSLQLALIELVSKDNFSNVCTVGDVQQSIYRFRGADVNVFKDYKNRLQSNNSGVKIFDLPNNYRSHADILALTDKIFESDQMFGNDFLHLVPKGSVNDVSDPIFANIDRVQIQIMNHQTSGKEKFLTLDATWREARKAAKHLKALKDAGAAPSSMAILLAKLASGADTSAPTEIAKIYQSALLEVGIESVISGGSTFSRSFEAQIVLSLLAIARNALDSDALAFLIRSELFNLSDDALLVLSSSFSENNSFKRKQDVSIGLLSLEEAQLENLSINDREALTFASEQITNFIQDSSQIGICFAIREFLSSCGVFDELQNVGSEGLVSAGNYEKALAILNEIQQKTTEIVEIHEAFAEFLENAKEAPGILSTIESDYVEIMTVHASKGLQFDHVVVAELKNGVSRRQNMLVSSKPLDSIGDVTCVSSVKSTDRSNLKKFVFDKDLLFAHEVAFDKKMTAGQLYIKMAKDEQTEELNEAKRLLYVALTRAVKSVMLQVRIGSKPKDDYEGCGIWGFLYDAFKWDYSCEKSSQVFELNNNSKGKLEFEFLPQALDFDEDDNANVCEVDNADGARKLSIRNRVPQLPKTVGSKNDSDLFSYSNLESIESSNYQPLNIMFVTDDDFDESTSLLDEDFDKATDFGSVLHSFFERSILLGNFDASSLESPRILKSVNLVKETQSFKDVISMDEVTPEMEFCVPIKVGDADKFIRGAIDLVGISGTQACVVDYKTGTKPHDHALQAKVYAYALLNGSVCDVVLHFVHAEIPAEHGKGAFVQSFHFSKSDLPTLKSDIEKVAVKL